MPVYPLDLSSKHNFCFQSLFTMKDKNHQSGKYNEDLFGIKFPNSSGQSEKLACDHTFRADPSDGHLHLLFCSFTFCHHRRGPKQFKLLWNKISWTFLPRRSTSKTIRLTGSTSYPHTQHLKTPGFQPTSATSQGAAGDLSADSQWSR